MWFFKVCEKIVYVCFDYKVYIVLLIKMIMICNIVWFFNFFCIFYRLMMCLVLLLFVILKMNFVFILNFVEVVI